jgi:hypothetical protein
MFEFDSNVPIWTKGFYQGDPDNSEYYSVKYLKYINDGTGKYLVGFLEKGGS